MTKEEFELLTDLEESAIQALNECSGYDCVEYDNGTFECDNCPFYMDYCYFQGKAIKLLKRK